MVPEVKQDVAGDNVTSAVASAYAGIDHTSTLNPTGPSSTIAKDIFNSDHVSDKEEYIDIKEVYVHALKPDDIIYVGTA